MCGKPSLSLFELKVFTFYIERANEAPCIITSFIFFFSRDVFVFDFLLAVVFFEALRVLLFFSFFLRFLLCLVLCPVFRLVLALFFETFHAFDAEVVFSLGVLVFFVQVTECALLLCLFLLFVFVVGVVFVFVFYSFGFVRLRGFEAVVSIPLLSPGCADGFADTIAITSSLYSLVDVSITTTTTTTTTP